MTATVTLAVFSAFLGVLGGVLWTRWSVTLYRRFAAVENRQAALERETAKALAEAKAEFAETARKLFGDMDTRVKFLEGYLHRIWRELPAKARRRIGVIPHVRVPPNAAAAGRSGGRR